MLLVGLLLIFFNYINDSQFFQFTEPINMISNMVNYMNISRTFTSLEKSITRVLCEA